jgi:hypothetical protein
MIRNVIKAAKKFNAYENTIILGAYESNEMTPLNIP